MHNLKMNEKMDGINTEKSNDKRYTQNASKQSTKHSSKQHPLASNFQESSNKSKTYQTPPATEQTNKPSPNDSKLPSHPPQEKSHQTIKVEQTTKPVLSKKRYSKEDQVVHHNQNEDKDNKKITDSKPVTDQDKSSDNEEDKYTHTHTHSHTIKVEKQESSSETEEEAEQDEEQEEEEEEQEQSDDEEFPISLNGLVFSFLPQATAEKLNDENDWKKRTQAIQETENLIKKQFSRPNEDFPIYITDICKKMWKMMHDSNFKISLTSLRIIHNLCVKYPKEIVNCLNVLVNNLWEKLSDNKIVIRHAVLKVFYALVNSLGPNKIIDLVFPFITHENWHIREEILSIIIMSWVTSNSTCGLSDPKMLGQISKMVNDERQKVSTAAFEALGIILSKDSSTAIILNSYLDPKIYNKISERCLSGILATVNYDGIVEFPTPQNSNHIRDPEVQSMPENEDSRKHTQSADHTVYSQNFQKHNTVTMDRPGANNFSHMSNYDKQNATNQSMGNKMWLPGFNMTASSIKSEQSVRVIKDTINHTPNQYTNKMSDNRRPDRTMKSTEENHLNYAPEVHQNKPRTFGNVNNPSMTAHIMNVASTKMGSTGNHITRSPISQADSYYDMNSVNNVPALSDYNPRHGNASKTGIKQGADPSSHNTENTIPAKGPIKPMAYTGMPTHTSLKTETLPSGTDQFDDDNLSENRQHRYSQQSNKSLETKNRNKNSLSQK